MKTFSFYALHREGSSYEYPGHELIEEATREAAIYKFAIENNMTIAESDDGDVWMELPDGAIVKYSVEERDEAK